MPNGGKFHSTVLYTGGKFHSTVLYAGFCTEHVIFALIAGA